MKTLRFSELKEYIKKVYSEVKGEFKEIEIDEVKIEKVDADISFPVFELLKEDKELVFKLKKLLSELPFFTKVEFINGYINLKIKDEILISSLKEVFENPEGFFKGKNKNKKVLIEYISANPTGPLNIANARAASIGDLLTKSFNISGYSADSEYYYNDCGRQVELLGISLRERIKELKEEEFEIPEDGYHGEYLKEVAEKYVEEKSKEDYKDFAIRKIIEMHKASLSKFGTKFKNFVYESEIRESGLINEVLERLKDFTYEKEGALYFESTKFGDDKDRVLIKANGEYTYFLVDIAYHLHKIKRGYDLLLNLWGPDHHGYITRMKGALKALSFENFDVLIVQQVNLKRGKELVRMSKRKGEIYTLEDLIDEVGKDAARFFLLLRSPSSPLDFDLELAKKMSQENPLYYVQYAHARANQIEEFAKKKGFKIEVPDHISLSKSEREIVKKIFLIQDIYEKIAEKYITHILPLKLIDITSTFHSFYQKERVVDEVNIENTIKRLFIVRCFKNLLKFMLDSIGVEAPLRM